MIAYADINIAAQSEDVVLARTIFAEARGEPQEGQIAVGYTIKHRAEIAAAYIKKHGEAHPIFGGGTIVSACLWSFHGIHQYSCWNDTDPARLKALQADHNDPAFCRIQDIARQIIAGTAQDRLPGTTHYYNPGVVPMPKWAIGLPFHAIGHHRFFRDVP